MKKEHNVTWEQLAGIFWILLLIGWFLYSGLAVIERNQLLDQKTYLSNTIHSCQESNDRLVTFIYQMADKHNYTLCPSVRVCIAGNCPVVNTSQCEAIR